MRNSSKMLLALLAMALLLPAAQAPAFETRDFAAAKTDRLKSELGLSDDQVTKIQEIYKNYSPKQNAEVNQERNQYFEARKASHEKMQNEINSVLTEEQRHKLETLRKNGRDMGPGRGQRRGHFKKMHRNWNQQPPPAQT